MRRFFSKTTERKVVAKMSLQIWEILKKISSFWAIPEFLMSILVIKIWKHASKERLRYFSPDLYFSKLFQTQKGPMVGVMAWDGMQKDLTHCIAWQKNVGF